MKLEEFEIVALLNLSPEDYDEAIALIPSLQKKISERNIEEILETISTATGRSDVPRVDFEFIVKMKSGIHC